MQRHAAHVPALLLRPAAAPAGGKRASGSTGDTAGSPKKCNRAVAWHLACVAGMVGVHPSEGRQGARSSLAGHIARQWLLLDEHAAAMVSLARISGGMLSDSRPAPTRLSSKLCSVSTLPRLNETCRRTGLAGGRFVQAMHGLLPSARSASWVVEMRLD